MNILEKIYNDPKLGLVGARALYEKVNELSDKRVTLKQVKEFLANNSVHQVNKLPKKSKTQRQILAKWPGANYQIDLTDMSVYARTNHGVKYLLTCVDVDSRYAWVKPLKNKTAEATLEEFEKIAEEKKPESVSSDNGSEFKGVFGRFLEKNNIKHTLNQPGDHNHMGIVESFHKTLRNRIAKFMTLNKTTKYVDKLDDIVMGYNDSKHSTTKGKPVDILNGKEHNRQEIKIYNEVDNFNIGDNVRVLNERKTFAKGTIPRWSAEVFKIEKKIKNKYKTSYGDKLFRDTELQRASNLEKLQKVYDLHAKVKKLTHNKKVKQELKRNDIDKKNILISRTRGHK